jgi:type I restriction enzyme S subunit
MEKRGKVSATPRLRFPEFRASGEWVSERLGKLYSFVPTNTYSRDKLNYACGATKNIHYGDIHAKFATLFDVARERVPFVNEGEALPPSGSDAYCREGDLVFADASEDLEGVGKSIEVVRLHGESLLAGQHTILARPNAGGLVVGFGGYLFRSTRIRSQVQKEAQGTKVYSISPTRLANVEILYPSHEREQRKIIDCLASLDDVIAAQAQKVEALKAHKRGLMQQLFPRDGETVPRLRFPEFRGDAAWVPRKIGDMVEETARPINMDDGEEYSLVTVKRRYGGVVLRERLKGGAIKVKSQFTVRNRDFLISNRQIVHNACGLLPAELDRSIVSNEYSVLNARRECDIEFFDYFAQQPNVSASFLQSSVGIVIEKMLFKLDAWLKLEFPFPSIEEQRAIAKCLGSSDMDIAAASRKLDGLMRHKQGLMQNLFPSPDAD